MSLFSESIRQAFGTIQAVAGEQVTYRRGSQWTTLTAVPGRTDFSADDGEVVMEYRSRDYVFKACDLAFNDTPFTPQRGDVIEETVGEETHRHEVLNPSGGEQVWRYSDHGRSLVRVHTKFVEVVGG